MTRDEWDLRISDIGHGIWVGEVAVRAYAPWLRERGIDTIVSCMTPEQHERYDKAFPVADGFKHWKWMFDDYAVLPPEMIEGIAMSFGHTTLVHCVSGVNRSTAVTLCKLLRNGVDPITAANMYYPIRGRSLAKVYGSQPEMTHQMVANVQRYWEYLIHIDHPRGA